MHARQMAFRIHQKIAAAVIAERMAGGREQHQRVHLPCVPSGRQLRQRRSCAFHPHRIRIVGVERLTPENGKRLEDTAAGIEQRLALVGDDEFRVLAFGQMGFHHLRMMMHIDHDGGDTGADQPVDGMVYQCAAVHHHKRLRSVVGQRAHPCAEPGGHDHCPCRSRHAAAPRRCRLWRASAGIVLSYQLRKGRSAGCARSRSR